MIDTDALDALVDVAIAPYKGKVSDKTLAKMKVVMRLTLEHHPGAAPLTSATVPHKQVESSSEVGKDGDASAKPTGRASGEKE